MDVVIVYHSKDNKTISHCLDGLKHIKELRNIYCISNERCHYYVDEAKAPFSLKDVALYVGKDRSGWYFQQLLKLYAWYIIPELSETYLIVDSDTIFCNDVSFITSAGLPKYAIGPEYHIPYFEHIQRLIPVLNKQAIHSGICHHMVFQQKYLQEMIKLVENIHNVPFWKCALQNVDPIHYTGSGMSEYELYFNYMLKYRPTEIELRELKWANVQDIPNSKTKTIPEILNECSSLDFVSIHSWYTV